MPCGRPTIMSTVTASGVSKNGDTGLAAAEAVSAAIAKLDGEKPRLRVLVRLARARSARGAGGGLQGRRLRRDHRLHDRRRDHRAGPRSRGPRRDARGVDHERRQGRLCRETQELTARGGSQALGQRRRVAEAGRGARHEAPDDGAAHRRALGERGAARRRALRPRPGERADRRRRRGRRGKIQDDARRRRREHLQRRCRGDARLQREPVGRRGQPWPALDHQADAGHPGGRQRRLRAGRRARLRDLRATRGRARRGADARERRPLPHRQRAGHSFLRADHPGSRATGGRVGRIARRAPQTSRRGRWSPSSTGIRRRWSKRPGAQRSRPRSTSAPPKRPGSCSSTAYAGNDPQGRLRLRDSTRCARSSATCPPRGF